MLNILIMKLFPFYRWYCSEYLKHTMPKYDIVIVSDSYLNSDRVISEVKNNLCMSPHGTEYLSVLNLAKGSLTWEELFNKKKILQQWISAAPRITVLHLGAVDIVSNKLVFKQQNRAGKEFLALVERSIARLLHLAKDNLKNFEEWEKEHRFLLVQLPDWGEYQARPGSLCPNKYRDIRRLINRELKNRRGLLWGKKNTLIVHPRTTNACMIGVHFDEETQAIYNAQIFEVVKKLACDHCRPPRKATNGYLGELRENKCYGN